MGAYDYRTGFVTAPIVNGGCYRKLSIDGRAIHAIVQGARVRSDGKWEGMLHQVGFAPELVIQDTESFAGWELYARPEVLDTPMSGTVEIDEVDALKAALAAAEAKLEKLEGGDVDMELLVSMKDNAGMKWSEIGTHFGIPWQTAKKLYDQVSTAG